jgi:hypothetical protein
MISIVTTSGMSFPQLEQDTILNAAEKSGVVLRIAVERDVVALVNAKLLAVIQFLW